MRDRDEPSSGPPPWVVQSPLGGVEPPPSPVPATPDVVDRQLPHGGMNNGTTPAGSGLREQRPAAGTGTPRLPVREPDGGAVRWRGGLPRTGGAAPRGPRDTGPVTAHQAAVRARAVQLATMFALDYLSWDEDEPYRRSSVVEGYVGGQVDGRLGWDGLGRQRAEVAVAGVVEVRGGYLSIDFQVRVTPYTRIGGQRPVTQAMRPIVGRLSSAPATAALRWCCGPAQWVHLRVPIRIAADGSMVVDPAVADPPTVELAVMRPRAASAALDEDEVANNPVGR